MNLSPLWLSLSAAFAERRLRRQSPRTYEDLIAQYAPGRTFADIGAMWRIDGGYSFLAEEAGATRVTAFDAMAPTPVFEAERAKRDSKVGFVRGDLHARETVADVGPHDVVWCTGLMYHTPNPLLAWEHLVAMTGEYLIIGTKTIPEVPGVPCATVFFPALSKNERKPYDRLWSDGPSKPYNSDPVMSYSNWWWGFSRSAVLGLARGGFEVVEIVEGPRNEYTDDFILVLKTFASD